MTTGLPEALDLTKDYQIEFTALDATTGADVTSVIVSNVSLLVTPLGPGALDLLAAGPFMLVPGPDSSTAA